METINKTLMMYLRRNQEACVGHFWRWILKNNARCQIQSEPWK